MDENLEAVRCQILFFDNDTEVTIATLISLLLYRALLVDSHLHHQPKAHGYA
jgi:hypothetical protein